MLFKIGLGLFALPGIITLIISLVVLFNLMVKYIKTYIETANYVPLIIIGSSLITLLGSILMLFSLAT